MATDEAATDANKLNIAMHQNVNNYQLKATSLTLYVMNWKNFVYKKLEIISQIAYKLCTLTNSQNISSENDFVMQFVLSNCFTERQSVSSHHLPHNRLKKF